MYVRYPSNDTWWKWFGTVDAFITHPDGKTFFRVNDHWFPADMCELVE